MKASIPTLLHLLLLTFLSTLCQAISITDAVAQLPQCGLQCIVQGVTTSPCHDLTNANCLCQDTTLYNQAQTRTCGFWTHSRWFFYFGETVYVLLLGLTKISMLLFFLRVFPPANFRRYTYITVGLLSLSTAVLCMAQLLQCIPVDKAWLGWQEPGFLVNGGSSSCINVNSLTYASAAASIFFDVVILLLPLPIIIRLDATRRLRAEIVVMLSVGVLVLITSCIRMRYIAVFADSTNPTWDATDAILWSGIEISVAVICISLPAIRVLFRSFCRAGTAESSPFRSPRITRRSRRFSIKSDGGPVPEHPRHKKETRQESSSSTGNRELRVRVEDLRAEFGDDIALEMTSGPHARAIDRVV
ncbi:hypothetical protein PspLS_05989 [Pyricularia sp. CBS 133598]|nr:hypothetical protein PspLS_05989 [Pyricularia sp. CBS 133598]